MLFFPFFSAFSQGFSDNFQDGDFTNNPTWYGDVSKFTVYLDGINYWLRLQGLPTTDTVVLWTPSYSSINASWEFLLRMDFNPSSQNYADIYIISNQPNVKGTPYGYFIRAGGTTDEVSLYRADGGPITKIIDGPDGWLNKSPNILRIKTTRYNDTFKLYVDTTGNNNFTLIGSVYDNTYHYSSVFAVVCRHTTTRKDSFYFDDFVVSGLPDTNSPVIQSISVLSNSSLKVTFSVPVDKSSGENPLNYFVDKGIGNPINAQRDNTDSAIVYLNFGGSFQLNVKYNLTASNILNAFGGGSGGPSSKTFVYYIPTNPSWRSIVINELYPDPNPPVGITGNEFVEIFNADTTTYNLYGWKITDGVSTKIIPDFYLTPGEYLILCSSPDVNYYSQFGNVVSVGTLPTLNNTGDNIKLIDSAGNVIDSVMYNISWYHDPNKENGGWTLEQINPYLKCSGEFNWSASLASIGGTPGSKNSIYDSNAFFKSPSISSYSVVDTNKVALYFDVPIDTFGNPIVASISPSLPITVLIPQNPTQVVYIETSVALDSGTVYNVTITGATSCNGFQSSSLNFSFIIGYTPKRFEVLITEIMADPTPSVGLPEAEYVEITNVSSKYLNLRGLIFTDFTTSGNLPDVSIAPNERIILTSIINSSLFVQYGKVVGLSSFPALNNDGDYIALKTQNEIIHSVNYSIDWYGDPAKQGGGYSLEMIDIGDPCGGEDNWRASNDPKGGTPGAPNSIALSKPHNPPFILRVDAPPDTFAFVRFSREIDSSLLKLSNIHITGRTIKNISFSSSNYLWIYVNYPFNADSEYTLTIDTLYSCDGLMSSKVSFTFCVGRYPQTGDLVINEILFKPVQGVAEFVEIYNNSEKCIYLHNWSIASLYYDDKIKYSSVFTELPYTMKPYEYRVITTDSQSIKNYYPNVPSGIFIQLKQMPYLTNDSGRLALITPSNDIYEKVFYSDKMHYSLLTSTYGVSLERISPKISGMDSTNWHSASQLTGYATPGYKNSQYLEYPQEGDWLTLSSDIISPDNDGSQDNLVIVITLDEPGYVGNIAIYSPAGLLIKNIAQNALLGTNNAFIWDGTDNYEKKLPLGNYILYASTFHPSGKSKSIKKVISVLYPLK